LNCSARSPRYYGQFHPTKRNRWVFGDRDSGAYLPKFAWTRIVRHAMVVGAASPDDPALADYWSQRRRKQPPPPLSAPVRHFLGVQQGRCTACGGLLWPAVPHRCPDDADIGGGEDRVEGGGELGVAVADQEPQAPTGVVEVHAEVRACWVSQAPVG
jgi:hypothetical protein